MTAISLVGCGGDYYSKGYSNGVSATADYASEDYYYYDGDGYSGYVDYSNTTINGTKVDYSYDLSARGIVDSKSEAIDFYKSLNDFVYDNDGYIENVDNTFHVNDMDDSYYYSDSDVKYQAGGYIKFTVQIPEEHSEEIITIFDDFCKNADFIVTQNNQYIRNYEKLKTVDDDYYDPDDYRYHPTKSELDEMLQYTDIDVSITYNIERNSVEAFGLGVRRFFRNLWDDIGDVVGTFFNIALFVFAFLFIIVIPVIKIFKKSMFKYNKKHPEYNIPKRVTLVDDNVSVVSNDVAVTDNNISNS